MLIVKSVIGVLFQVVLFGLPLLLPAGLLPTGTWLWEDAIIFLLLYFVLVTAASIYLCIYYPEAIEARLHVSSPKQPMADKFAITIFGLGWIGGMVCIPIDVFHWTIFTPPSFTIQLLGLGIVILGLVLILITHTQNAYIAPIVAIQKDRGQVLIDTGLYAYVRHPMYLGFLLLMSGKSLWLGSVFFATFGAALFLLVILPRIFIEEKTLKNGLKGYEDYLTRVRYRIIPKFL